MLFVIITVLCHNSGAHFNPAVSLAFFLRGELSAMMLGCFVVAQVIGGVLGVWAAHLMFDLPALQISQALHRTGATQWFSEILATMGLLFVIWGASCAPGCRACVGGDLHHRCVLVHVIHQFCQSCHDLCTRML